MSVPSFDAWNKSACKFHLPPGIIGSQTKEELIHALVSSIGEEKVTSIQMCTKKSFLVQFSSPKNANTILRSGIDAFGIHLTASVAFSKASNVTISCFS